MTETDADMYAEYIAILCSAAIAVFWSGSPHYVMGLEGNVTMAMWKSMASQAGLEVLVDYVSCLLEIRVGIGGELRDKSVGMFLSYVSIMLVITNLNTSGMLYIRSR